MLHLSVSIEIYLFISDTRSETSEVNRTSMSGNLYGFDDWLGEGELEGAK